MTTATIDPAVSIAAAGHELLDALRELVDRGDTDDVPGLLDDLTRLLRRARGKVNRATKRANPEPSTPTPAPATPPATPPATTPAVTPPTSPAVDRGAPPGRTVTVPLPRSRPTPPPPVTPTAPRRRTRWRWWAVAVVAALLLVVLVALSSCSSVATVTATKYFSPPGDSEPIRRIQQIRPTSVDEIAARLVDSEERAS